MFKDILVPMVTAEVPEAAIRAACAIAEAGGGHVDALVGASLAAPNAAVWAYYPEGFYESLKRSADAAVAGLAARAAERLDRETVPHGVRRCSTVWLSTTELATVCARHADLVVLERGASHGDRNRQLFGSLLAGSGRPILLVPREASARVRHARIVVAWKPTREATRALHDALPLLWRAHSVEVLRVGDEDEPDANRGDARLLAYLARQGVNAQLVRRARDGKDSAGRILDHAATAGADLIVAGGYGHSRAREYVFGGVTEALFRHAACPVLFSH